MLKKFVNRLGAFVGVLILYFLLIFGFNKLIISRNVNLKLDNCEYLIIGDSHMQQGIDPNYFNSARNIAQYAEPYFLTFWKLKKYLSMAKVENVLIGFSYRNISEINDKYFIDKKKKAEMFNRCHSIEELLKLKTIEIDWGTYLKIKFKKMCLYPNISYIDYIGAYSSNDKRNPFKIKRKIKSNFYHNDNKMKISNTSNNYLDSILSLCKNNNVKPILVTTPLHSEYISEVPTLFSQFFKNKKKELLSKNIKILDYSCENYSNSEFYDSDHLNLKGSQKFSNELSKKLCLMNNSE